MPPAGKGAGARPGSLACRAGSVARKRQDCVHSVAILDAQRGKCEAPPVHAVAIINVAHVAAAQAPLRTVRVCQRVETRIAPHGEPLPRPGHVPHTNPDLPGILRRWLAGWRAEPLEPGQRTAQASPGPAAWAAPEPQQRPGHPALLLQAQMLPLLLPRQEQEHRQRCFLSAARPALAPPPPPAAPAVAG